MSKKQQPVKEDVAAEIAELIASETPHKDDESKVKPTMTAQLQKHRGKYEACVSYTNRLSLNNGDEVATLLQGATPEAVVTAAEILCGFKTGELTEKYAHLNKGQKRMNAGNRIRSAVKKGTATTDQLVAALVH